MEEKFELPQLPYGYDSLEPFIDEQTMRIHHDKHHQGYTDKFNTALEGTGLADKKVEEILGNLEELPADKKQAIINNGGGYYNHSIFWEILSKDKQEISEELTTAINETFESLEKFKEEFSNAAKTRFGSGWAWLVVNEDNKLEIVSTANQDSPISNNKKPLLCIDVWEHAYYLKYQNKRPDYVEAFWNVVNWEKVSEKYKEATQ